jgi:glycosyltransferase involved in cell wall biosynthesis
MKILMLGWEFPPFISGGLGTACHGLTRGMSELGAEVLFVLPRPVASSDSSHVKLMSPQSKGGKYSTEYRLDEFERVRFQVVQTALQPYQTPEEYDILRHIEAGAEVVGTQTYTEGKTAESVEGSPGEHYAGDMFGETRRYERLVCHIAEDEDFDVIHAHDWMTYPAGLAVAKMTGKPLVVHVHSTEFDRSGENVNQGIYDIERAGVHGATKTVAVSFLTKNILVARYGISADRVEVVYNAINANNGKPSDLVLPTIRTDEKIVLFLGRITMQKGPEYFLAAAKKVLEVMDDVRFIMAGSGDMIKRTIEMAAQMGIGHKVLFTGFLRGEDVERVFRMADLYVMPSVSEPFGIAPLEALSNDVPVIISKQSGVAEMLTHCLKVDFWDVDEMANKIIAVLRHPPLHVTLREHGNFEVRKLSWTDSARRCLEVYDLAVAAHYGR